MVDGRAKDHTPTHQVMVASSGHPRSVKPLKGDEYLTDASGITSRGLVAAWSIHTGGQPYPYLVSTGKHPSWTRLPALRGGPSVGEAMGVDSAGDVTGWMVSPSGASSLGVEWRRWGGSTIRESSGRTGISTIQ